MTDSIRKGDGWAVGHLDDMGEGYGFRKVRKSLDVTAFGVNAIVLPPDVDTGPHFHDQQEELYFVHRGTLEMTFTDGTTETLTEGAFARVDPATHRSMRNPGPGDVVILIAGGKDGYVGRDGHVPEGADHIRTRTGD